MELVVANRFRLIHCIGSGSFGEIYVGNDLQGNNDVVALKLESINAKYPQLQYESSIYQSLQGGCNIARFIWFGNEAMQNIMVIQNLGKSLDTLFNYSMNQFSMKTVLMIADQMISAIEFMHKKGFIHRDIKPENFLMGADKNNKNLLYIIDFGLSSRFLITNTNSSSNKSKQQVNIQSETDNNKSLYHIHMTRNNKFIGNAKFQSINGHKGLTLSRRDDMEAIAYLLIYFLKGSLPWDDVTAKRDKKLLFEQMTQIKIKTSTDKLCQSLPKEFSKYLNSVKELKFDEEPHYAEYKQMFRDLFIKMGYTYDYDYDWTGTDYAKPITSYSKSTAKRNCKKENLKSDKRINNNNKMNLLKNYHLQRVNPKNGNPAQKTKNGIFEENRKSVSSIENIEINEDNENKNQNSIKSETSPSVSQHSNNPSTDQNSNSSKSNSKQNNEISNKFNDEINIQFEKARWHSQTQFNLKGQKFAHFDPSTTETDDHKENEREIEFLFENNKDTSENKIEKSTLDDTETTKKTAVRFYTQKENHVKDDNLQKTKLNINSPKLPRSQMNTQNTKPKVVHSKTRSSLNPDITRKNQRSSRPLFDEDIFSLSTRSRTMRSKAQKQKQQQTKKIREVKSENPEFFPLMNNSKKLQTKSQQKT